MNKEIQEFHDRKLAHELQVVKILGDEIGYGNLMSLASALWRDKLKESGTPTEGAFVPALIYDIKKSDKKTTQDSCDIYDEWVKKYKK